MKPYHLLFAFVLARGLLFFPSVCAGQAVACDTSLIHVRLPEQASLDKFRNSAAFQYDRNVKPAVTIRDYIQHYINKLLDRLFGGDIYDKWLRAVIIVLLVAFTVFILFRMYGVHISGIFFHTPPPSAADLSESSFLENAEGSKLRLMLEKAVSEGRYRSAARLVYLLMLRRLSELEKIRRQPGKTNLSYSREISEPDIREHFLRIAGMYEYAWYGDFDITAERYRDMERDFNELDNRLR
jgi:hypothetical protein